MKKFILFLFLATATLAQDINPGISFADGQRITAAQLLQLVNQATINPAFYTAKIIQTQVNTNDVILVYSPSSGVFHQVAGSALLSNPSIITGSAAGTPEAVDQFLFYSIGSAALKNVTSSNLAIALLPWLPINSFVYTNLTNWSGPFVPSQTNNQPYFLVWDTNGVPKGQSLSNLYSALLSTNSIALNQLVTNWLDAATVITNPPVNVTTNTLSTNSFVLLATSVSVGTNTIPTNTVFKIISVDNLATYFNPLPVTTSCRFNGTITGTNAAYRSVNVSNVVHNSIGIYTVNFTNSFANTNYLAIVSAESPTALLSYVITSQKTNSISLSMGIPSAAQLNATNVNLVIYP